MCVKQPLLFYTTFLISILRKGRSWLGAAASLSLCRARALERAHALLWSAYSAVQCTQCYSPVHTTILQELTSLCKTPLSPFVPLWSDLDGC